MIENEKITEITQKLGNSPLFNFSLGSKELFHSDFLYWFGNKYKHEFGGLFKDYIKDKSASLSEVKRERNHIDLTLTFSNNESVLIENKVKSIAKITQLEKYTKSKSNLTENNVFVLLALSRPPFFNLNECLVIEDRTWYFVSYEKIKDNLFEIAKRIDDEYDRFIINDYRLLIKNLLKIEQLTKVKEEDIFNFHSGSNLENLKKFRIHDLYLKKKYENLAFLVYEKLSETDELKDEINTFGSGFDVSSPNTPIYITSGMTNSTGITDIKYVIEPGLAVGIQIQGEHYRMIIEGGKADAIKDKLVKDMLWFDFQIPLQNLNVYPISEGKNFNEYRLNKKPYFFYKSVKLGVNYTIQEILEFVEYDISRINSNIYQLIKIAKTIN